MDTELSCGIVALKNMRKILESSCGKGKTLLRDLGTEEYKNIGSFLWRLSLPVVTVVLKSTRAVVLKSTRKYWNLLVESESPHGVRY